MCMNKCIFDAMSLLVDVATSDCRDIARINKCKDQLANQLRNIDPHLSTHFTILCDRLLWN